MHVGGPQRVRERLVGLRGEELDVAQPQAAHVGLERRLRRALAHDREHDVAFVTEAVGRFDQRPQRLRQAHVARVHHDEPVVPPPLGAEHGRPSSGRTTEPSAQSWIDDDARSGPAAFGQPAFHVPAYGDHAVGPPTERRFSASRNRTSERPDPPEDDPHLWEDVLGHVDERDAPHGAHRRGGHGDDRGDRSSRPRCPGVGRASRRRAAEVGRVVRGAPAIPALAVERRGPHAGDVHALDDAPWRPGRWSGSGYAGS